MNIHVAAAPSNLRSPLAADVEPVTCWCIVLACFGFYLFILSWPPHSQWGAVFALKGRPACQFAAAPTGLPAKDPSKDSISCCVLLCRLGCPMTR